MADEVGETVTISIRRSTDTPPVFVAGTFTKPAWDPLELVAKPVETANAGLDSSTPEGYIFFREFKILEGQYQYRFRLGPGDSWFHDEGVESSEF
jgi:hypothetical protein